MAPLLGLEPRSSDQQSEMLPLHQRGINLLAVSYRNQTNVYQGINAVLLQIHSMKTKIHYRAVWISDLHLFSPDSHPEMVDEFLRSFASEYLYLVGDVIDLWQMKMGWTCWYWPKESNEIIRRILKASKRGTKVIYIIGNHEGGIKDFMNIDFGSIAISESYIHRTADDRLLYVCHGDEFDRFLTKETRWLSLLAYGFYHHVSKLLRPFGIRPAALRKSMERVVENETTFSKRATSKARAESLDGVVCGHLHSPNIIDVNGVSYMNCGDWVNNFSALVEDDHGKISLVRWPEHERDGVQPKT